MLGTLICLPLAALLAPTAAAPVQAPLSFNSSFAVTVARDSGDTAAAARMPLTQDMLVHYIGTKKDLNTFWTAHKVLLDSARTGSVKYPVKISTGQSMPVGVFDYVDLAGRHPEIAAIFKKNNFEPNQFKPTQLAAFRAVLASEVGRALKKPVDDSTSIAGKNVALVEANKSQLAAAGVAVQVQGGGGGGGGMGGSSDLDP